jgi:hypothetical protein
VFFYRFLDSKNESVEKFVKKSKLTEIFEYAVKTIFACSNFKKQYFSKISSTILLDKMTEIQRRTLYQKLENGGVHFSKKLP